MKNIVTNTQEQRDIRYSIIDIECLKGQGLNGLFTFQWRHENMDAAKMVEVYNDIDAKNLYENLKQCNRALYCFSINYDKVMLNALCKLVEKQKTNIVAHLRRINDFIIKGNLNYFEINRDFWDMYYKNAHHTDKKELFEKIKEQYKNRNEDNQILCKFIDEYDFLLGQSQVFRQLNIIDVPKMLYYYSIRKDGIIRPSISLKNLQLYEEGYNITHDFDTLFDIDELKRLGLFEDFRKYSLNDVDFLYRYFIKKCLPVIKQRYYACKAIQRFNSSFTWDDKMIHSESNTNLLISAFSTTDEVKRDEEEKLFDSLDELSEYYNGSYKVDKGFIDLSGDDEFIKEGNKLIEKFKENTSFTDIFDNIKPTGYEKFDRYVEFVKRHSTQYKKDKMLKENYCNEYDVKYEQDDKTIEHEGRTQTIAGSFDEFEIFGTMVKIGNGGIHGALLNYMGENLFLDDYEGLYPSIARLFKKYFKRIINMDLYDTLFKFRNEEVKPQLKAIDKKIDEIGKIIEKSGNDMGTIADYECEISDLDKQKEELQNLSDGAKLLLNSLYGLINSEFNFSVSNKELGRFICLYGQYRAIELCKLIKEESPESVLVNINTDGIAIQNINLETIERINKIDSKNGLKLEGKKIDRLIQVDVNNYIKITNNKLKTKGTAFATGLKQAFCRFEKLPCNMINALNLVNNEPKIEILPVLFHQKNKKMSTIKLEGEETSKNKVYYLTNEKKGKKAVKHIANPIILSLDSEIMYFTTKKEDADIREYTKFARITQDRIMEFRLTQKDNMKYYEYELKEDTDEKNVKLKNQMRLKLNKIFPKLVCYNGFKGSVSNILTIDTKTIPELSNYTMTQIKKSNEVMGISIVNDESISFVTTKNENDIDVLKRNSMFHVKHLPSGTHLFVLEEFNPFDYEDSVQLQNEYIPVWDLKGNFEIQDSI